MNINASCVVFLMSCTIQTNNIEFIASSQLTRRQVGVYPDRQTSPFPSVSLDPCILCYPTHPLINADLGFSANTGILQTNLCQTLTLTGHTPHTLILFRNKNKLSRVRLRFHFMCPLILNCKLYELIDSQVHPKALFSCFFIFMIRQQTTLTIKKNVAVQMISPRGGGTRQRFIYYKTRLNCV